MEVIKILVVFLMSVAVSKITGFIILLGYAFVNKKKADVVFRKESSSRIIKIVKLTFLISCTISSTAAYFMLKFLNYRYSLIIAFIMFTIKLCYFSYKYKKTGKDEILSKLS